MGFWEDEIDVDDSDLPSLLNPISSRTLPSLQPCSQSQSRPPSQTHIPHPPSLDPENSAPRSLIPGPAGAVQASMHRRSAAKKPRCDLGATSDCRSVGIDEEEDGDFKLDTWLFALNFLGLEPDFVLQSPIGSIGTRRSSTDRVPQVVGIVKSCVPNGLGDLFVTLKDPTGTIGASINRKVLMERDVGGDISVGCVLILKQVVVFSPRHSVFYLNVTPNNVVKLISKDCGPCRKQTIASSTVRYGASGKHMEAGPHATERLSSVRQSAENAGGSEARRNTNIRGIMDIRKTGLSQSSLYNISSGDATTNMAAKPDLTTNPTKTMAAELEATERLPLVRQSAENAGGSDTRRNTNTRGIMDIGKTVLSESLPCNISAIDATANMGGKPDLTTNPTATMAIELDTTERLSFVRQSAENAGGSEARRSMNTQGNMDIRKTGLSGSLLCDISARDATTYMASKPDLTATMAAKLNHEMNLNGAREAAPTMVRKPDLVTAEPKKLISKVSVAQWTDEQLAELFSDYQDDTI